MNNTNGSYISTASRLRAKRWFIPRVIIIGTVATVAQVYLPWWSLLIGCFVAGFSTATVNRSPFMAGFLAIFISWGALASYIDYLNNSILSSRVVQLFPLPESGYMLIVVTAIIGGLVGGISTACGDAFRRMWIRN